MGHIELNIYQRTILFLLLPIILPTMAGIYAAGRLREAISELLPDPNNDFVRDYEHIIECHHRLYKYATLGGTPKFERTLVTLARDQNALVEVLSYQSPQKNTFLHIAAAARGCEALANVILEIYPQLLFMQNKEGESPLHIAAKEGKLKIVEALLDWEKKIKVELATDAAENGYQFLQNMRNNQGNTALLEALVNGHAPVAQYLIDENPTITNFFDLVNEENKSPLYQAVEAGNLELVKKMDVRAEHLDDRVCLGWSPMHAAVLSKSKKMLEMLSRMRLNIVNPEDEKGKTPLHNATSTGYLEGVRFLLSKSTNDAYRPDWSGVFPIHTAAGKGYLDIIVEFLERCPDAWELQNRHSQNILHVAAKCGRENVVKYVLKNQILRKLINQKDNNGDTPLHLAAKYRHPLVVNTLTWDERTSLKLINNEGNTAIDVAEGNMDSIASFHGRLTWIALKSGRAPRAQHLHVLLRKKEQAFTQMPSPGSQFPNLDQILGLQLPSGGPKLPIFESFKDRVNTLLVVTTLVATVTFAAGFTMPGGYNNSDPNQGMATMLRDLPFQVFVICDTMAMYGAIIVAVTLVWAQLGDLNLVLSALRLALPMLGLALTMMSVAFTAGVYVVVSDLHWLAHVVVGMGGLFVTIILLFVPLFFPSQSSKPLLRYLTYYPFRLVVLAFGNYNQELEE